MWQDGKSIDGVTLGLDLTLRELQTLCKKNGHPWTTAKVFPSSAIVGPFISMETARKENLFESPFTFSIGGELKQKGFVKDMMMSIEQALPYISSFFNLCPGDYIFTGTPAGVGPLRKQDVSEIKWNEYSYQIEWR